MLKFQYKQMIIDEVLIQLVYPMNHLIHSIQNWMKQLSPASFLSEFCHALATMKTGPMLKFQCKTTIIDDVLIRSVYPF